MIFKPKSSFLTPSYFCLLLIAVLALLHTNSKADTNAPLGKTTDSDVMGAQDFLRSYLQLQEEVRDTQVALQKIRLEAAASTASNSVVVDERLRNVEKTIADEHTEQLNGIAHLGRTILIAAGTYAAIGFLGLLLVAFLQFASINRLAAAANLSASRQPQSVDAGSALLPPVQALEQSNTRLLDLMDRLEHRIQHLEVSTSPADTLTNGNGSSAEDHAEEIAEPARPAKTNTVSLLISKSQTLLKLDRAEAALDCLDEALSIEPDNADAWVKRGAALEHLQRIPEAVECYDRALAQNASMTMAYLHKGSLFTRMERHAEALACYEQALKSGKGNAREADPSNQPGELVGN